MTTSYDFAELLQEASIGTIYTDIFPDSRMPDIPNKCITVNESGGSPTEPYCNLEYPTVIILVREVSTSALMSICKDIRNALLKNDSGERRHDFTKNSTRYLLVDDHGGGWSPFVRSGDDRLYRSRTFRAMKGFEGDN